MNAIQQSLATSNRESHELVAECDRVLRLAHSEVLEDGMENSMSRSLRCFVERYSLLGIEHLAARLLSESMNQSVAADIVRVLGWIEHRPSHDERVRLAEHFLRSSLPLARDASAVALSDLADARSIPALERAINAEEIPALKAYMAASLKELKKAVRTTRLDVRT